MSHEKETAKAAQIMKITVDLENFWSDENEPETLAEALKFSVKHSVIQEVKNHIKDKVDAQITSTITEYMDNQIRTVIDDHIQNLLAIGRVKKPGYRNDELIGIEELVKETFEDNSRWRNLETHIDRLTKKFTEEMKQQYNNVFAAKIVQNLDQQKMLSPEISKILLGDADS